MNSIQRSEHKRPVGTQFRWSEQVAQVSVVCSSALAAAGVLIFLVGGLAHSQGSDVVAALVFGLPACLLYTYAGRRVQRRDLTRGIIACLVGGVLTITEVILVGLSAAYSDPCFQVAHCTRGPTFAYVALSGATIVFVLAGVLGLIISPLTIAFLRWQRFQRGRHEVA